MSQPQPTDLRLWDKNLWPQEAKCSFAPWSLKILQLAFWTDAFPHTCVKITQIKLLKNRSRLLLLVRIHYSRPWFFDILINSEVCIEDQTAAQASRGVFVHRAGETRSVSCMRERGEEAKYLQCTRTRSFPRFRAFFLWGMVQSS